MQRGQGRCVIGRGDIHLNTAAASQIQWSGRHGALRRRTAVGIAVVDRIADGDVAGRVVVAVAVVDRLQHLIDVGGSNTRCECNLQLAAGVGETADRRRVDTNAGTREINPGAAAAGDAEHIVGIAAAIALEGQHRIAPVVIGREFGIGHSGIIVEHHRGAVFSKGRRVVQTGERRCVVEAGYIDADAAARGLVGAAGIAVVVQRNRQRIGAAEVDVRQILEIMIGVECGIDIAEHVGRTRARTADGNGAVAVGQHRIQIGRRRIQRQRAVQRRNHQCRIGPGAVAIVGIVNVACIGDEHGIQHRRRHTAGGTLAHRQRAGLHRHRRCVVDRVDMYRDRLAGGEMGDRGAAVFTIAEVIDVKLYLRLRGHRLAGQIAVIGIGSRRVRQLAQHRIEIGLGAIKGQHIAVDVTAPCIVLRGAAGVGESANRCTRKTVAAGTGEGQLQLDQPAAGINVVERDAICACKRERRVFGRGNAVASHASQRRRIVYRCNSHLGHISGGRKRAGLQTARRGTGIGASAAGGLVPRLIGNRSAAAILAVGHETNVIRRRQQQCIGRAHCGNRGPAAAAVGGKLPVTGGCIRQRGDRDAANRPAVDVAESAVRGIGGAVERGDET